MRSVIGVAVVLTVAALSLLVMTKTGAMSCGEECNVAHRHHHKRGGIEMESSTPWGRMEDENGNQIRMMRVNQDGFARAVPYGDASKKAPHHKRRHNNSNNNKDQEENTQRRGYEGWKHHRRHEGDDHHHQDSEYASSLFVFIYVLKCLVGLLFCHLTSAVTSAKESVAPSVKRRVLTGCVVGHTALTVLYSMGLFSPVHVYGPHMNWCFLVRFYLSLLLASSHGILSTFCLFSFVSASKAEEEEEDEDVEKNGGMKREDKVSLLAGKDVFPLLPFGSPSSDQPLYAKI